MDYHSGSGVIVYDPYRPGLKSRTQGWCVVNTDPEIARYFRWWMSYEKHIHLQPSAWGAHISIVRGERLDPSVQHLWKKYHGHKVNFLYEHVSNYRFARSGYKGSPDDGVYYWVDVECPLMDNIRKELGLRQGWKFHLTFGRTHEYSARVPKKRKR